MNRRTALGLVATLALLGSDACLHRMTDPSVDAETAQLASDGSEMAAASAQTTHLANLVVSSVSSQEPSQAAATAGAKVALWPPGCLSRSIDPTDPLTVRLHFDDCTGPFGLVHVRGDEVVTFSAGAAGALHAEYRSDALTANGLACAHQASADITVRGTSRDVAWRGTWARTSLAGVAVAHTSDLAVEFDLAAGCRSSTGSAVTTVGSRTIDTAIDAYRICWSASGDACPSGSVVHTSRATGRTLRVSFDGTSEAQVVLAGGRSFDVPLVCGG